MEGRETLICCRFLWSDTVQLSYQTVMQQGYYVLHDQPFEAFHHDGCKCNGTVVIKAWDTEDFFGTGMGWWS